MGVVPPGQMQLMVIVIVVYMIVSKHSMSYDDLFIVLFFIAVFT